MIFKSLIVSCLLITSSNAFAWGKIGHRVVGQIAADNLTLDAKRGVEKILGVESLAKVSTWADEIKSHRHYDYAGDWHFVNYPYGSSYYDSDKSSTGDILKAIIQMDETLRNKRATSTEKQEALKFLVHFIGDLHQPLHVGQASDRGGNLVKVFWFDEETNLHKLWDEALIRLEELSYSEYAKDLNHFTNEQRSNISRGTPMDWANESRSYKDVVYDVGNDRKLGYVYQNRAKPIIDERLRNGGLRLAWMLNDIFGNRPHSKEYAEFKEQTLTK